MSPPWGFSNVLHCPRTLGETFKRKVEHFNTLQKVLAIPGGKFTPLINGQRLTFILYLSAQWVNSCLACLESWRLPNWQFFWKNGNSIVYRNSKLWKIIIWLLCIINCFCLWYSIIWWYCIIFVWKKLWLSIIWFYDDFPSYYDFPSYDDYAS